MSRLAGLLQMISYVILFYMIHCRFSHEYLSVSFFNVRCSIVAKSLLIIGEVVVFNRGLGMDVYLRFVNVQYSVCASFCREHVYFCTINFYLYFIYTWLNLNI